MDEKRMEKQIKKAKRANYIIFGIASALLIALAVAIIAELNKPLDKSIRIDGLQSALSGTQILTKANGSYYQFDGDPSFMALLELDKWEKCSRIDPADEVITFHLGRQYSLTLYADGHAMAVNGYAEKGSLSSVFYEVPLDVAQNAAAYVEKNGTKMDFEDGVTQSMTMDSATSE